MDALRRNYFKYFLLAVLPALVVGFLASAFDLSLLIAGMLLAGLLAIMFVKAETATLIILFAVYGNLPIIAVKNHGVPPAFANMFVLLLVVPFLKLVFVERRRVLVNGVFLLMLLYAILLVASAIGSPYINKAVERLMNYFTEGLVLFFLFTNIIRSRDSLRKALWAMVLSGVLVGSVSLIQEARGDYKNTYGGLSQHSEGIINTGERDLGGDYIKRQRLSGTIGEKNRYGEIMLTLIPLTLLLLQIEQRRLLKYLAAVSLIPVLGGMLLSYSRSALLSLTVLSFFMARFYKIRLYKYALVLGVAASLLLILMPEYRHRIETIFRAQALLSDSPWQADAAVRGRATSNIAALRIFFDYPILGIGPGQTKFFTAEYGNEEGGSFRRLEGNRRAHNMYLEELSDNGIIGFMAFMSIAFMALWRLNATRLYWDQRDPVPYFMSAGVLLSLIGYYLDAIFLHLAFERYYWLLLAIASATVEVCRPDQPETEGESPPHLLRGNFQ